MSETGTTYDSWKYIGYEMRTNTVFHYYENTTENGSGSATTTALTNSAAVVWKATPVAALNSCTTDGSWTISIKTASSGNGAGYKAGVSSADCNVLAPSFGKLDETGAATIGSGS